jgi:hypothetical protein
MTIMVKMRSRWRSMVRVAITAGTAHREPRQHRHEGPARQPHGPHDAIHQVGDPGQVAEVLEEPEQEEQEHDLRQEDDHRADAVDDAVDQEVLEEAVRQDVSHLLAEPGEAILDERDRRVGPGEERHEQDEHDGGEDHQAEPAVQEHAIDPLGAPAVDRGLHQDRDPIVEPAVAAEHRLVVDRGVGRGGHHRVADGGRDRGQLVVAHALQGPQRQPVGRRPARRERGAHGRQLGGQRGRRRPPPARGLRGRDRRGGHHRLAERRQPDARPADHRHHRAAELGGQGPSVGRGRAGLVGHGQRDDAAHAQLLELDQDVQAARELGRVDAHHDRRRRRLAVQAEGDVESDLLVGRAGDQAVGARHVDQLEVGVPTQRRRATIDGDPRVVADLGVAAGQAVPHRGLAGVGVAEERDVAGRGHRRTRI